MHRSQFTRNLADIFTGLGDMLRFELSDRHPDIRTSSDNVQFKVFDLFAEGALIDRLTFDRNLTLEVEVGGAVRMVKLVPEPLEARR